MNWIAEYWWVWLICVAVFTIPAIVLYIRRKQRERQLQAQFVVTGTLAIGCILFLFNIVGIIAAIMSIISGVIHVFLWFVNR